MSRQVQYPPLPPLCQRCKGHGATAKVVRNFQTSVYDGQPWSKAVDRSDDARFDVIRPEECPHCLGVGYEK